jgi:hypothetical protein
MPTDPPALSTPEASSAPLSSDVQAERTFAGAMH